MIDSKVLLADLQERVTLLRADLAEQLVAMPAAAELLRAERAAELMARRTAAGWSDWRDAQLTQIAVAWVLGTVFLRWTEDNGLIAPVLSGAGDRLVAAEDAQLEHFRRHPEHNDGDWLAEQFDVLRGTDAGRLLFDDEHNPMYWLPISHDAAKALVAFWRTTDVHDRLHHDFTDDAWDTRFLGDLYQDLSEDAKKRYALLQTPRFIERFILDRTLKPAMEEFGLDGLRLIDPACGSGHFLLGAFERLVAAWREEKPDMDPYELVQRALGSVHGADLNPFAVAIARFRLLIAGLQIAGVTTLAEAARQTWRPMVACTDSLRTAERQESFAEIDEAIGYRARWEDVDDFADQRLLASGSYHVVVANPPYITVKDPEQSKYYRRRWPACHRQFQLTVPFAQRIFDLARRAGPDGLGAGYTGQITSNAFMKREFGTKLIEEFFPTIKLNYVVNASGAYIPGHGTPTVILVGRRSVPNRGDAVRVVLSVRGEPSPPADPERGLVWTAIEAQVEHPNSESDWVSTVDLPRERLASHPWPLSGGGASDLVAVLEASSSSTLSARLGMKIGFASFPAADEVFLTSRQVARRLEARGEIVRLVVIGDLVRDWRERRGNYAITPYGSTFDLLPLDSGSGWARYLWPNRRVLQSITGFGEETRLRAGEPWWAWYRWVKSRYAYPLSIAFAEVATHNHFVLDRGGKVFKQTAPVIKLPPGAGEDDHLALLGVLNSSTACFWLKQVCQDKPSNGVKRGLESENWTVRYQLNGSNVEEFPLPPDLPLGGGRQLDELARRLEAASPESIVDSSKPNKNLLEIARDKYEHLRSIMISAQEELDWDVYRRYGLLSDAEAAVVLCDFPVEHLPTLKLGERAFEIVFARRIQSGQTETHWFARHKSLPIVEVPAHWPDNYKAVVRARIELIEKRRDLALIEHPNCKRRWAQTRDNLPNGWVEQQERALRNWLLDRLEARELWFVADMNGDEQPAPRSVKSLADRLRGDSDFGAVARLWAGDALGRPDAELADVVGALVDAEHVPFLPAYRYKQSGLAKRAEWEHTWELQRHEDAIATRLGHDDVTHKQVRMAIAEEIGEVPVPPKYGKPDFVKDSYWAQRGKLDVPKERFISYPGASRDGDASLLLGWAGWNHREQAQALAMLITQRRNEDGWLTERVQPLLAGLAEVLPWVHQWHGDIDPVYGAAPGDLYDGFLDAQLGELQLGRAQLAGWEPKGRVDVSPMPRRSALRNRSDSRTDSRNDSAAPRTRRARSAPEVAHLDAVLMAAKDGPLASEHIRDLTGLDAAGARAVTQHLIADGRLVTTGQRRGTHYLLPNFLTGDGNS